jgi:hypothetical protein
MKRWPVVRLVVLFVLVATFAWVFFRSGSIGGGHRILPIETPFKTERDWARQQIAADIEEMAAYADHRKPVVIATSAGLPETAWDPQTFAGYARTAFKQSTVQPSILTTDYYPQLTSVHVAPIAGAASAISKTLATNMRDPRAHESAALVIGAFALREAADRFTDVRWAMNRMTAHLAAARALREDDQRSPDGSIAEVILATLSNHQTRAMSLLRDLGSGTPPEPLNAWIRALSIRLTQDWRLLAEPASATRLEKLEFVRARRATVRRRRAREELNTVGEDHDADYSRIAQNSGLGVQDGNEVILSALELELAEAAEAHVLVRQLPMPARLADALNHRATRLVTGAPDVLPWGAWAEFFQRHIAMNIGMVDSHLRHMQGDPEEADQARDDLDRRLGDLTYFPLGTLRRTKGRAGTEADLRYVSRVVELSASAPEIITCPSWIFFETGAKWEPIRTAMTKPGDWFTTPTKEMPYEAGVRSAGGWRVIAADLNAVIEEAPYDRLLLQSASVGVANDPVVARARTFLAQRYDYDLGALDTALEQATNDDERLVLLKKSCALSSRDCAKYARFIADAGRADEAAKKYEEAFADPMIDSIALAADADWLINYYYRNKRTHDAIELADRAASSGSANGLENRAYLLERLGSIDEAERDYLQSATSYQWPAQLIGFYHRRVLAGNDPAYKAKYDKWVAEVFPRGMQPEAGSMTGPPKGGVYVTKDSERSRKAGIRAGDIIVGLEGWKVETFLQYAAINAFKEDPHMKLSIWRGSLVKVEADQPGRLFGTSLADFPLKGHIQ